jgi:hypothetical protein
LLDGSDARGNVAVLEEEFHGIADDIVVRNDRRWRWKTKLFDRIVKYIKK